MSYRMNQDLLEALRMLQGSSPANERPETLEEKRIQSLAEQAFRFLDANAAGGRPLPSERSTDLSRLAA